MERDVYMRWRDVKEEWCVCVCVGVGVCVCVCMRMCVYM